MFREIFSRVVQLATTVSGVLQAALPYPASLSEWPRVVIIGAWAVSLLSIRPYQSWSKILLTISMIVGLGCGFWYWVIIDSMTVEIDGNLYIRGELTESAKAYKDKNPAASEKQIFIDSGKREDRVWKPESMRIKRFFLGLLYSLFIFFFGLSLIGALEKYARENPQCKASKRADDTVGPQEPLNEG